MPKGPKTVKKQGPLTGLAQALGNCEHTRNLILETQTLLKWPSPQKTGVVNAKALRMNVDLMIAVGSNICPGSEVPLALYVGPIKCEACLAKC